MRSAFLAGWESGGAGAIVASTAADYMRRQPAALVRRSRALLGEVMPTFALRHAGGSWMDVLLHPAFRLRRPKVTQLCAATTEEAAAVHRVPMACRPYLHNSHRGHGHGGDRGMGPHPDLPSSVEQVGNVGSGGLYGANGVGVLDSMSMSMAAASFVSSSGALRHAGCSWFDVARHTAFHTCVQSRVAAASYALYLATFVKHPFSTALITSVTKCVASDVAVQYFVEGRKELDTNRVFCFFTLGLTYVGAFQYGLYNHLMKPLGGALKAMWGTGASVGTMVAIDTFLVCPFIYLPAFFGLKLWANGECTLAETPAKISEKLLGSGGVGAIGGGHEGEQAQGEEGMGWMTLIALWAYWMPAQAINFWVVPRHLTIPFMNVLGFGWNCIMSAMNGADDGPKEAAKARAMTTTEEEEEEEERRTRLALALVADAAALAAAAPDVEWLLTGPGAVVGRAAMRDFLAYAVCLKAISMASMDALAIARVGVRIVDGPTTAQALVAAAAK